MDYGELCEIPKATSTNNKEEFLRREIVLTVVYFFFILKIVILKISMFTQFIFHLMSDYLFAN
uniref:Uncharacterized protein n=1 Tax=Cannabis sativa TaxID=3483 RepID=A0A803R8T1_CANSA